MEQHGRGFVSLLRIPSIMFIFIFERFIEGGWVTMSLLTINLVLLIVSIWKAPHLVRKLGRLAWGIILLMKSLDLMQMLDQVQAAGGISPDGITQAALCGGFKVLFIPVAYAALIYTISVVSDIVQSMKKCCK